MMVREDERVQSKLASKLLGGKEALEKYNKQVEDMLSWLTENNQYFVENNLLRIVKGEVDSRVLKTIEEMGGMNWIKFKPLDIDVLDNEKFPKFIIRKIDTEEGTKRIIEIEPYGM
jgi:hypothetical protein